LKQKRFDEIENDLERAVFLARYNSRRQRSLRFSAIILITAKHGLRGLLYVWPLVVLLFVDFPGIWNGLRLLSFGLGVVAWSRFIYRSVYDDYVRFVAGVLLEPGNLRRVL